MAEQKNVEGGQTQSVADKKSVIKTLIAIGQHTLFLTDCNKRFNNRFLQSVRKRVCCPTKKLLMLFPKLI